jgi:LmbE family N-acetylglucosaminyl deacetylase
VSAPDVVVLSPHLDDAALAIGALLARLAAAGRRVAVWSAFTRGPPLAEVAPERRIFGDYATRRAEDERAMRILGAEPRWLELVERIWRAPALPRVRDVFRTPPTLEGFAALPELRAHVGALLDDPAVHLYAPLGVGHHHDHVEVALAALAECAARGAWDRVRFYEDVYALGAGCRRRHPVTARRPWRPLGAPAWASPRIGAILRLVASSEAGPGIDVYLPEAATLRWISVPEPCGDFERIKLLAVAEYRSQVTAFGGLHQVSPFLHRGHEVLGGEPIWFARPSA